ncbi:MAG: type II toxin-antitoxin system Phd/YefM family antitoxin [Anaerolineae bacterium]
MEDKPNTRFIISTTAQNNFGRLLDDVSENRTRYIVKRFGTPKAAIVSIDDLEWILEIEARKTGDHEYLRILRESLQGYSLGEEIEIGSR